MRIRRLEVVAFGRLRQVALDFRPGLNVVFGPNEAGKSTLLEAIYTLLYGPYKEGAAKRQLRPEVRRYDPWSGGTPRGSLVVEFDGGRRFRLDRRLGERPTLTITDLTAGADVTAHFTMGGRDRFAEELLGVGGGDFRRTAWMGQADLRAAAGDRSLAERIRNLAETGDETVYGRRALERLTRALEELGRTESGQHRLGRAARRVAELEAEVSSLLERRRRFGELEARLETLAEALEGLRAEAARLRPAARAARAAELRASLARIEQGEAERARLAAELDELRPWADFRPEERQQLERLAELQGEVADRAREEVGRLAQELTDVEDRLRALPSSSDVDRAAEAVAKTLEEARRRRGRRRASLLLAAGAVAALGVGLLAHAVGAGVAAALLFALATALTALGTGRKPRAPGTAPFLDGDPTSWPEVLERLRRERAEAEARRAEVEAALRLAEERAREAEAASRQARQDLDEHRRRFGDLAWAEARRRTYAERLERLRAVEEALRMEALRLDPESARRELAALADAGPPPEASFDDLTHRLRQVEEEIRRVEGEIAAGREALRLLAPEVEHLPSLLDELEDARRELAQRREEREALGLAVTALEAALTAMHEEVSPRIAARFVALLRAATGERFAEVAIPADLRPRLGTAAEGMRAAEDHSHGTAELVYLCLRLALAEVLGHRERLPLLLDDPLVHLDRERAGRLVQALARLAADGQAILLTCHEREWQLVLAEGGHGLRLGDEALGEAPALSPPDGTG